VVRPVTGESHRVHDTETATLTLRRYGQRAVGLEVLSPSPLDAIRIAGAVVVLTLALVTARNHRKPGSWAVTGLLVTMGVWLVAELAGAASGFTEAGLFWAKVVYTDASFLILLLFLFALTYTGNDEYLTPRTLGLLSVEPVLYTAAIWTNHYHGLFWRNPVFSPDGYWAFEVTMGPVFYGHLLYSYGLVVLSTVLVVRLLTESQSLYPRQVYAVLAAILGPFVTDLLYQFGVTPIDMTPLAMTGSGLLVTLAVFRFKLLNVSPVTQDTVVENIRDGLLVLDRDDEFVEINSVARSYLDLESERVVGRQVDDVLSAYPQLRETVADATGNESEVRVRTSDGERFFHVQVTPLTDHREELIGRQVLIHDVTDRVERQRELERQNEQLDRFAGVVSHDLRNPLNVASGRLELLSQRVDDENGDLEAIERSHRRMERLIDDVLALAREGQTISETERVSLPAVADAAWKNTETGDATLAVETDVELDADGDRLRRLFENLFRNAVEHGSTGNQNSSSSGDATEHAGSSPIIEVGTVLDSGSVDAVGFYVADDGPGIPPGERERVLEDGFTTDEDGTGLGLSIVASIADAHGWSVDVTESESGGARFEIRGVPSATECDGARSDAM
jgi:PAS domain S-box-containing protein